MVTLDVQALHHSGKDPHITPALPFVVEGLGTTILARSIACRDHAIDKDYAVQHATVIDTPLAWLLGQNG
jgi:hypothetical protein